MSGASTVRTTEGPWETQRPFLGQGFGRAEQLYKAGPTPYFPGETVAGFDPAQQQAQAQTLGYLGGPRPAAMQAQAERQLGRTYDWAQQIPELAMQGARAVGPTLTDVMAGNIPWKKTPGARTNLESMMKGKVPWGTGIESQLQGMQSGAVPRGAGTPYGDLSNAYRDAVVSRLTDPTSGVLPQIRGSLVNYQPGGSTRGNMLQQAAIANAVTQGMSMPMAQMYGNAYQQAQAQRLPAMQQQQATIEAAQARRLPSIQQQMGAAQAAQAQRLPAAQQALGAYQQAMGGIQQGAQTGLAGVSAYPTIMGAPLAMYQAGGDVGQQRRAMAQEAINQQMAKYNYAAQAPQIALQNYMAGISGEYGGVTTQQPSALSQLGQAGSILSGLGNLFGTGANA